MSYFENSYGKISYDDNSQCVNGVFHGFAKGDTFREPLEKTLELMKNKMGHKFLADTREVGAIDLEDKKWHDTDWAPRFIQAGGRHVAIVIPQSAVAKMSVSALTNTETVTSSILTIQYFGSVEEGKAWLQKQP